MQACAYIPQARQSMATAGKINLFGGGEMWSARLHSPPVPSLGQQSMVWMRSTCAQSLSPLPCQTCALVSGSGMWWQAGKQSPIYIFLRERGAIPRYFPNTWHCACTIYKIFDTQHDSLLYKYSTYWENMHLILYYYMMCLQYFTKLLLIKHLKTLDIITM